MRERKHVWKVFFAWQEEKEAAWLSAMSASGWHLNSVGLFNYSFVLGVPEDFIYQFDFIILKKADESEYLQMYADAGWERIDRIGSWYYFRKPVSAGGSLEIYTGKEGLKNKYKRLLLFLFLVTFPVFYNLFVWPRYYANESSLYSSTAYSILRILMFVIAGLALTAMIRIALHIRRCKNNH